MNKNANIYELFNTLILPKITMPKIFLTPKREFKNKRRKEKIRQKISDISFGAVTKICDFILISLIITGEAMKPRLFASTLAKDLERICPRVDTKQWIEGFHNIRRKRWIDGNSALTKEGRERLQGLFPKFYNEKHWDKTWHLVNFDIPETMHRQRDILREKLKSLGFGMMQQSVWISPVNFLGTVQKEVKNLGFTPFVLCAQSQNLGEEDSKVLTNRIWHLEELNIEYKNFIEKYEKGIERKDFYKVFFNFVSIFQNDPQLPVELLPKNWYGREAYKLSRDFYIESGFKNEYTNSFFGFVV